MVTPAQNAIYTAIGSLRSDHHLVAWEMGGPQMSGVHLLLTKVRLGRTCGSWRWSLQADTAEQALARTLDAIAEHGPGEFLDHMKNPVTKRK